MNESNRPEHDEQIDAPRELIDALADLHNERIFVPPSVDESIMAEARKHLQPLEAGQASPERGCAGDQPQHRTRQSKPDSFSSAREREAAAADSQSGTQPRSNIITWSGWGVAIAACVVLMLSLTARNPQRSEQDPTLSETADMAAAEEMAEEGSAAPAAAEGMIATTPAAKTAFAREDVNRDNTVDILDAFALARQIEGAQVVPASYDFNNDGAIDRADVDWVARVSVKL